MPPSGRSCVRMMANLMAVPFGGDREYLAIGASACTGTYMYKYYLLPLAVYPSSTKFT
eukprot:SAG11_NODE_35560_length_266_cov_0.610778_1_plen_57_part_10